MKTISEIIEIVGEHRISGEPEESGDWLVWSCRHSAQTMEKFVGRCKKEGVPAFFRNGRFGVLRERIMGA